MKLKRISNAATAMIAEFWNVALTGVSIVGLLLTGTFSDLEKYKPAVLFLAINAAIWTLVEIKIRLYKDENQLYRNNRVKAFATMRSARDLIISQFHAQLTHGQHGKIMIVGGRIRSIIEIFREIEDYLRNHPINNNKGCLVEIFTIAPDYLQHIILPGEISKEEQIKRSIRIRQQVEASVDELEEMSRRYPFSELNMKLRIHHYRHLPFGYYFLFGDDALLFGGYLWNPKTSDIDGPGSSCWFLDRNSDEFDGMFRWLDNRAGLARASSEYSGDVTYREP